MNGIRPKTCMRGHRHHSIATETSKPMWRCPVCQRQFANRNQSHACGRYDLKSHFLGKPLVVRQLYDLLLAEVQKCGSVIILPEKTRIAFQVRMSFAAIQVQSSRIIGHLVLAHRHDRPCFHRIDSISRHNHVHHFRLEKPEDLNEELCRFIQKAYLVGQQQHLKNHP
jgi:Domain of unknown function (DUF5655)